VKSSAKQRLSTTSRALAGTLGAYAVTSLTTVVLSLLLARTGLNRVEAVTAATLPCFAVFAVIALAAFHGRTATRVWAWLAVAAAILGALWLLLTA
jgi:hypothetical protein